MSEVKEIKSNWWMDELSKFKSALHHNAVFLAFDIRTDKMSNDTIRAGQTWPSEEWAKLGVEFQARNSIPIIAAMHQRTEGAIVEALKKVFPNINLENYPGYEPANQMKLSKDQQIEFSRALQRLDQAKSNLNSAANQLQVALIELETLKSKLSK